MRADSVLSGLHSGVIFPTNGGKIFDLAAQSALLHRSRPAFRNPAAESKR